jgi:hypothetical protein
MDRLRHLREQGHRALHPSKLEKDGGIQGDLERGGTGRGDSMILIA